MYVTVRKCILHLQIKYSLEYKTNSNFVRENIDLYCVNNITMVIIIMCIHKCIWIQIIRIYDTNKGV